tara:strand:- start:2361 stop:3911 length:1551 start_codon:yes stop_codon:yes gene_type:complete
MPNGSSIERMKKSHLGWMLLFLILCISSYLQAQNELWGIDGSEWTPTSPIPDFSFAGYHQGEIEIPNRKVEVSVVDFGAVGDGKTDCSAAFAKAINESGGRVIGVPPGIYILSDRIRIEAENTILKGAGVGETILHFEKGLQEVDPTTSTTGGGVQTNSWSWSGGIITIGTAVGDASPKTPIVKPATRGQRTLSVQGQGDLNTEDVFIVQLIDDTQSSLFKYLYRGRAGDISLMKGKRFKVSQPIKIEKIDGTKIHLNRPLRFDVEQRWKPVLLRKKIAAQEIGICDLTIRFPKRKYRGHWMEDGMNGLQIQGINNWAKNIRIQNCDSGVFVKGLWNTVDGLIIESKRDEHSSGNSGHHGISLQGSDCLISNFKIRTKFYHDVTVSSSSVGNVFSQGEGIDLCIDHHRAAPYENLFTQIHVGKGSRVWKSGGSAGKGLHTASGATFWNIDSEEPFSLPPEDFGPGGLIFVGLNTRSIDRSEIPEGWHFDDIKPGSVQPANLYRDQLKHRINTLPKP